MIQRLIRCVSLILPSLHGRRIISTSGMLFLIALVSTGMISHAAGQSTNPASESDDLFLFRPDTPSRQVRGAILAQRLDRPGLAAGYLTDLLNSQPSSGQLLALRREFGIGQFVRLSAIKELQPVAGELLSAINDATKQNQPDESQVMTLISELGQSPKRTTDAALQILAAGDNAIGPLVMADASTESGRIAQEILKRNARRFRSGLVEMLPDSDPATQTRIVELLSQTADTEIALDLIPYQFSENAELAAAATTAVQRLNSNTQSAGSKKEAVRLLLARVDELLSTARSSDTSNQDADESVQTDAATRQLQRAAALARAAVLLAPEDTNALAAQIVSETAEQTTPFRWPENLGTTTAENNTIPSEAHTQALRLALHLNQTDAICGLLSHNVAGNALQDNAELLRTCLTHSDCRVRLLAAGHAATAEIKHLVRTSILNTVHGAVKPEAVVIDSRKNAAAGTAAELSDLGYTGQATVTGKAGFDAASEQLCCELILVHANCLHWSLSETVANLRKDFRTQAVPIVIYGTKTDSVSTQHIRTNYPQMWFVEEPVSAATLPGIMKLEGMPAARLTNEDRIRMIAYSRTLLNSIEGP